MEKSVGLNLLELHKIQQKLFSMQGVFRGFSALRSLHRWTLIGANSGRSLLRGGVRGHSSHLCSCSRNQKLLTPAGDEVVSGLCGNQTATTQHQIISLQNGKGTKENGNMMSLLTCASLPRGQSVTLFRPLESHHSGHEVRTQLKAFWSVLVQIHLYPGQ